MLLEKYFKNTLQSKWNDHHTLHDRILQAERLSRFQPKSDQSRRMHCIIILHLWGKAGTLKSKKAFEYILTETQWFTSGWVKPGK